MIRGAGRYSTLITPTAGSLFHAEFHNSSEAFNTLPIRRKVYFSSPNLLGGTLATASGLGCAFASISNLDFPVLGSSENKMIAFG